MRLFLGDTCWDKIFDLPKKVQTKIREFQRKFKDNPYAPAINLEPIVQFRDNSLRTARIGDDYRAIVGVIPNGDFCLLYVDHHDEAMRWAMNKRFTWNEHTQAFQIITVVEKTLELQTSDNSLSAEAILPFEHYMDDQLLKIGVPEEYISLVHSLKDLNDLGKYEEHLPVDAFENLFYLLDGDGDIDRIIFEIEEGKNRSDNFADQLSSINNKRRFVEITDDEELDKLLDGDLKKWQIFLHPSQRKLVETNFPGSIKVSGGGGTGKTVAAIHRLKHLTMESQDTRILFTTYTSALTENLKGLIQNMGVDSSRYLLCNVDALAMELAKKYNILPSNYKVIDYLREEKGKEMWEEIVSENLTEFDAYFLYTEYLEVILYNNIESKDVYFRQSRIGRVKSLSRKQRNDLWKLVEVYVDRKKQFKYVDRAELFNLLANYFNGNEVRPFAHVIADEIQDFSNPELRFLRSLVAEGPNDLFLVGDPFQRIYNNRKINFSSVGINVRGVRSKRLRINYRTTEEIKKLAVSLVKDCSYDDFDGSSESISGYISLLHGDRPEYTIYKTKEEEITSVLQIIQSCNEQGIPYNEMVIACYFSSALKEIQSSLHNCGIPYMNMKFKETKGSTDGVRLSTFHGMKGLEFKVVILSDVNDRTLPYIPELEFERMDKVQKKNFLLNQKALMYVALTRAMQKVFIVGAGKNSSILKGL